MINIHTIHAAQEGDEDAIQQIFESFKQLMIFKTKKYFFLVVIEKMLCRKL